MQHLYRKVTAGLRAVRDLIQAVQPFAVTLEQNSLAC